MYFTGPAGRSAPDDTSREDLARAESFMSKVSALKAAGNLDSLKMRTVLPSGAVATVFNSGGIVKMTISPPPAVQDEDVPDSAAGVASLDVPILFCGRIKEGRVIGDTVPVTLTPTTVRRYSGYDPDSKNVIPSDASLARFRVGYNRILHSEFEPKNPGPFFHTQYQQLYPSWFSGSMRAVVQVSLGWGIQDFAKLPKSEQVKLPVPARVLEKMKKDSINIRLPGYLGKPPLTGELQFDYKWHNTDALAFDAGDNPWLIKVCGGPSTYPPGVWAMPLPVIFGSLNPAFRAWIEEVGDEELIEVMDTFKGIPSGEGFPEKASDFQAWRRAGVIIKVCETADYYDHLPYSTALGFCFNSKGRAAVATCYDYDEGEGLAYGLTYKMRISLGIAKDGGRLPPGLDFPEGFDDLTKDASGVYRTKRHIVNDYLSSIYRQINSASAKHLAIKYKIRRSSADEMLSKALVKFSVDQWDDLELAPIATHSGSVTQTERGWLYHPAHPEYQPKMRFPEPMGDPPGCYYFNFNPLINGRYKTSYPRCDTTMFAYFAEDDLKTVKYFRDEYEWQEPSQHESKCPEFGDYEYVIAESPSRIHGDFYTTDQDDRHTTPGGKSTIKGSLTDLGFDDPPFFGFSPIFGTTAYVSRKRYGERNETVSIQEGYSARAFAYIPWLNRNVSLYGFREWFQDGVTIKSRSWESFPDPHTHAVWTYHKSKAWINYEGWSASPWPVDGYPVMYGDYSYAPSQCGDIADDGRWEPYLEQLAALIQPNSNTWAYSGGGSPPSWLPTHEVIGEQKTREEDKGFFFNYKSSPVRFQHKAHARYFSGDNLLGPWTIPCSQNCAGRADYIIIADPFGEFTRFGFSKYATNKEMPRFIGVINE